MFRIGMFLLRLGGGVSRPHPTVLNWQLTTPKIPKVFRVGTFFSFLFIFDYAVFSLMCGLPRAAESRAYFVAARRLLTAAASLVAKHRL